MDKGEPGDRQYAEIPNAQTAMAAVEEALADHNATSKRPMPLAMFLFALEHVSRISRLMKQPGGHMLLVGVGGSGRQSLARLAAYMAGLEVFQVGGNTDDGRAECCCSIVQDVYALCYSCWHPDAPKTPHAYVNWEESCMCSSYYVLLYCAAGRD
jgi:hypothetical protein